MFSSEELQHVWRAGKAFVLPLFVDEVSDWRKPDPMEHHFRDAAVAEYGAWAWDILAPQTHAEWDAFARRIRRNGPSLKKKHARYRRIWIAALALRLKE